ncbi:MAG: LamG domain-containing protein [Deltaproteobacteria bacterium]|nr:LamG domain-containing protein [Deltaproteobacteria bacterium]
MMNRLHFTLMLVLAIPGMVLYGCPAAPEHCTGCLARLADARPVDSAAETGIIVGSGGDTGSGGTIGTGGVEASGGMMGTGGQGTGGAGSGGRGTGGSGTGGASTGGSGTGGRGTGGSASGGSGTGGMGTGGNATGGTGMGGGGGADTNPVLWYKFDETAGTTTAADSAMWGGTARPGMLGTAGTGGIATFSTTRRVGTNALSLTPAATLPNTNGGFVTVPSLHTLAPGAITIAVWVNLASVTATENWERVYDFGTGSVAPNNLINMYLTARAGDALPMTPVRFTITTTGHAVGAEQRLDGTTALTTGWHHIVVVLPASATTGAAYTGTLYIDGVVAKTNNAMTLHMSDLGATTNNWIGRSKFAGNPFFRGLIDDFRVYNRALSAADVTALFAVR